MLRCAVMVLAAAAPLMGQYAGPAILSRGEAPAEMTAPTIRFSPYVELDAVYESGLAGVSVTDAQGNIGNQSSSGVNVTFGITGVHSWKKTKLGLDYRGSFSHYNQNSYFDEIDQALLLGVTHDLSRHVRLALRESVGMFNRSFGQIGLQQSVPFDPTASYIPATDFFDNRTIYATSQADLTWQKSARTSINIGGDGFTNQRRSKALFSATGAAARADVQYRLTRRQTVGVNYMFMNVDYSTVGGGTDLHGVSGTYAVRIDRTLEFSAYAGFMRVESKFIRTVQVDPVIAALLGISTSSEVFHGISYTPNASARLSKRLKSGVLFVSGGRSVIPGNGLFLTSFASDVVGGYTYTGLRRWSFSAQAGYTNAHSIDTVSTTYGNTFGGFSVSRSLRGGVHLVAGYQARSYNSPDINRYNRLISAWRLGIGFAPGDIPLRIW